MEKTVGLDSVGERPWKCDRENRDWWWRQINVKRLGYIQCFNASWKGLLTEYLLKVTGNRAILWNQKLWCGTLFLHKNKMKGRILQACSLKHSIKRGTFSAVGKMNLSESRVQERGREGSPPNTQPSLHPLGYVPGNYHCLKASL